MQENAIKIIREELEKSGIKLLKIILFGSRARGDFTSDSDWDFLIIVDKRLNSKDRHEILREIYRKLAKLEDSYELILKPVSSFEKIKNLVGCVSYDADKEGVVLWES